MYKHTFYYFLGNKKYPEIYILQQNCCGPTNMLVTLRGERKILSERTIAAVR